MAAMPSRAANATICCRRLEKNGSGLGAESEEKREPVSDIDTGVVDTLKALDPRRPIREGGHLGKSALCRYCSLIPGFGVL